MPTTYTLISANTLSSSAASVTFSAIPSTYTDLVLRASVRGNGTQTPDAGVLNINSNGSSNFSSTYLRGTGSAANSARDTAAASAYAFNNQWTGSTADTFGSFEIYIPNYGVTGGKPSSSFTVTENNATAAYMAVMAMYSSATAAITSLTLSSAFSNSFVSGSSFYLYGIKNS
jgi:hypothetical protein